MGLIKNNDGWQRVIIWDMNLHGFPRGSWGVENACISEGSAPWVEMCASFKDSGRFSQVKAMLVEAHWWSWNGWRLDAGRTAKLENLLGSISVILLGEAEGGEHFPLVFSTLLVQCTSFAFGNEINENKDDRILSLKKRALLSLPMLNFLLSA